MKTLPAILALACGALPALAGNIVIQGGEIGTVPKTFQDQTSAVLNNPEVLLDSFSGKPAGQSTAAHVKPSRVTILTDDAGSLAKERKPAEAEEKLQQAEALDSGNPLVIDEWVELFVGRGDYARAREHARRRVDLNPQAFAPRVIYADLFLREKRYDAARDAYEKVLADFPESQLVWLKLLLVSLLDNKPGDTKPWLDRFTADGPSECARFAAAAVEFAKDNPLGGRQWVQKCFRDFGTGQRVFLLYKNFADLGWVRLEDYPGLQAK